MSTQHRRDATQIAHLPVPKLPQIPPKDWPPGLYQILRDLLRALELQNSVIFAIQDNGSPMPLRASLNFQSGVTLTDDLANDRINITVP